MLRSLYSGISGLRAHQTMLDVTGNNIANVNTQGFKASSVEFQDTLSQMTSGGSSPQAGNGGTNPAQVGLGVQVAGIATNFTQGSSQATGKGTDLLISGSGFFVVKQGGETLYTRAGSLGQDAQGNLVTPDGGILQGWTATNGTVNTGGPVQNLTFSDAVLAPATATTTATASGNLPADGAGSPLTRDIQVFDAQGKATSVSLKFTYNSANNWTVSSGATSARLAFGTDGKPTAASAASLAAAGTTVNLSGITGFADLSTVTAKADNGGPAGSLESFSMSKDGTIVGTFTNGDKHAVGQIAMANFTNPDGLEKAGDSTYRAGSNSGAATIGQAGTGGIGSLVSGSLEMSNVDLSQEFTNLIVAQRGFQANARVITTSDSVLQELIDLKR